MVVWQGPECDSVPGPPRDPACLCAQPDVPALAEPAWFQTGWGGLQEALQQDVGLNQGYIMCYPSSRILAIKMARYSEDLHRCGCSYGFTVFYKVGLLPGAR